jgi:hypothetical protein
MGATRSHVCRAHSLFKASLFFRQFRFENQNRSYVLEFAALFASF